MKARMLACLSLPVAVAGAVPAVAGPPTGGAAAPGPPALTAVQCLADVQGARRPTSALLRGRDFIVEGAGLGRAVEIIFHGRPGRRDDVQAQPRRVTEAELVAAVPEDAASGKLSVVDRFGHRATTTTAMRVSDPASPTPIDITPHSRFFFDSRRKPAFAFNVSAPTQVRVEVASSETGEAVQSWTVAAQPGVANEVRWNGLGVDGVEAYGSYNFRLSGEAGAATSAAPGAQDSFLYADHLFPIRGRHNLGYTATNSFGGGRNHQGQDMFAKCGTRLAAARGGRVQFAGFHSAAGNYLVIDGAETGVDYVYMHMLEPPLVKTGDRVLTGQNIGEVGETGRATGCHLHFELWSAPGWYTGGKAFDPLPSLELWDGYS